MTDIPSCPPPARPVDADQYGPNGSFRPSAHDIPPPTDDELRATFRRLRIGSSLPVDDARLDWLMQALDHGWIIGGYRRAEPIGEWASRLSREAFAAAERKS